MPVLIPSSMVVLLVTTQPWHKKKQNSILQSGTKTPVLSENIVLISNNAKPIYILNLILLIKLVSIIP